MIELTDVWQYYSSKVVLRGVSLSVASGEVVVLMGPNGMGKSTILSVMAGLVSPMSGHVKIDGKQRRSSVEDELAIRRKTFHLPAQPKLPSGLTGREWIVGIGRAWGVPDMRLFEHVDRLISIFAMEDVIDSTPSSCSTGQRQKIALAGMLASEAKVLLLDEPFSGGLDPLGISAIRRIIEHMAHQGEHTIVIATPVPELVQDFADRVAIVVDGTIIACDSPRELQRQTATDRLDLAYEKLVRPGDRSAVDAYIRTSVVSK